MNLNIKERILLLNILPKESNFITLKIIRKLQEELSFTEQEIKEFEITTDKDSVKWNINKDKEKNIEIGEKANEIIVNSLKDLDKNNKINNDIFDLYTKFIKE